MNRARYRIKPELWREHYPFAKDSGTNNAIFMIQMISTEAIHSQKNADLGFIEYEKSFGMLGHKDLSELLGNLDIFEY